MKTIRIPTVLVALAAVASAGSLHAQQPTPQATNQRDPAATNNRDDGNANAQHQQGVPLKEAITQKLQKANEAEIELAKLAIERSDNQQVKQLAQTIMQDHQACNEKLQKMHGQTASGQRPDSTRPGNNNPNANTATNPPRTDTGINNPGVVNPGVNSDRNSQQAMGSQMVPGQLIQIMDQACDNSLKMTKEMLQKYEGQDFSMAFLGQQCVAHTMMLAELKAIQSEGPEELKSLAEEAAGKVQSHLDKAKQLAKQLEDDRDTTRAAKR